MKRQKKFRILSFFLCCMFLLCAGCEFGGGGFEDGISTQSLAGAKVISRPADYSFLDAVGGFSANYYNLLSREILLGLYGTYNDMSSRNISDFFQDIDTSNGITYGDSSDNRYYLYDSVRYTITGVKTVRDDGGNILSQTVTLNLDSAWNWKVSYDADNMKTVFYNHENFDENSDALIKETSKGVFEININGLHYSDWTQLYEYGNGGSYLSVYTSGENGKPLTSENEIVKKYNDYWFSPFYREGYEGAESLQNYYQDALEYATYLFVLGYDYDEIAADAPYFDFAPQFASDGSVSDVTVNYGGTVMSVGDALQRVKERYSEAGNYVGLTDKNKGQIKKFVLEKVIGNSSDKFDVKLTNVVKKTDAGTGITTEEKDTGKPDETLHFNRNYDKIVENIIDYACTRAPIGFDNDGSELTLDKSYPVSQITDFEADNFFLNYNTPDGKNDDENEYLFYYAESAEYQSFVLYPLEDQISSDGKLKYIHDLWMAFEYNDEVAGKTMLDELQINVGVRYFSKSAGEYTVSAETQTPIKIARGKNTDGIWGDNTCYIGYSEREQEQYQIATPSDFSFKTDFNRNIGNGAIDPRVDGTEIKDDNENVVGYKKLITGTTNARNYYKLNNSSSYGAYVTLDPKMFKGDDGCDYMEIYFDIVKDKTQANVNYNFKMAIGLFGAYSPEELGMSV